MIGTYTIQKVEKALIENVRSELRDQGHHLTGALEESMHGTISSEANGAVLEIQANDYMDPVNDGVPAANIPYSPDSSSGAKHSKYIEGLKNYAKLRFGLNDDKDALSAAFAIARKHAKEGMPTSGSYAFSHNGRRKQSVSESYQAHEQELDGIIADGLNKEVDDFIEDTFDETIF